MSELVSVDARIYIAVGFIHQILNDIHDELAKPAPDYQRLKLKAHDLKSWVDFCLDKSRSS